MKISIVTVCLNSEKTILATLNSVLTQSYKNIGVCLTKLENSN